MLWTLIEMMYTMGVKQITALLAAVAAVATVLTLAMPVLLLVTAPSRPSVCVPCHELLETAQPSAFESAAVTKSPGSEASGSRASPSLALVKSPGPSSLIMS